MVEKVEFLPHNKTGDFTSTFGFFMYKTKVKSDTQTQPLAGYFTFSIA